MPWAQAGRDLVLWNLDCLAEDPAPDEEVIVTEREFDAIAFIQAGFARVVSVPNGAQSGGDQSSKTFLQTAGSSSLLWINSDASCHKWTLTAGDLPAVMRSLKGLATSDADGWRIHLAARTLTIRCSRPGWKPFAQLWLTLVLCGRARSPPSTTCRSRRRTRPATTRHPRARPPRPAPHAAGAVDAGGAYGPASRCCCAGCCAGSGANTAGGRLLTSFEERIKPRYHRDLRGISSPARCSRTRRGRRGDGGGG